MPRKHYPSDEEWDQRRASARACARIANRLKHGGITVALNTSDETLAELQKQADELLDHAALAGTHAADVEDERVRANLYAAQARFLAIRQSALEALHLVLAKREAAGQDNEDPAAVERKALEFLRGRGWKCTGPGEDGR